VCCNSHFELIIFGCLLGHLLGILCFGGFQEKLSESLDALTAEEKSILERQKELKGLLYGRFGKAINLEE